MAKAGERDRVVPLCGNPQGRCVIRPSALPREHGMKGIRGLELSSRSDLGTYGLTEDVQGLFSSYQSVMSMDGVYNHAADAEVVTSFDTNVREIWVG